MGLEEENKEVELSNSQSNTQLPNNQDKETNASSSEEAKERSGTANQKKDATLNE